VLKSKLTGTGEKLNKKKQSKLLFRKQSICLTWAASEVKTDHLEYGPRRIADVHKRFVLQPVQGYRRQRLPRPNKPLGFLKLNGRWVHGRVILGRFLFAAEILHA